MGANVVRGPIKGARQFGLDIGRVGGRVGQVGDFLKGLSNPLILGLIFGGSAIFNMIGAARQKKEAKGYQDYFWDQMQGTEMDMKQSILIRGEQYKLLRDKLYKDIPEKIYGGSSGGLQSTSSQVRNSRGGY